MTAVDTIPTGGLIEEGVWTGLRRRKLALLGLFQIAVTLLGAIFVPYLTQFDPDEQWFEGLTITGAPMAPVKSSLWASICWEAIC